ncbi:aminomethyl transferase family protein [Streptomyces sp. NPDC097610]|uniref:aminomethyl transferase family protein n=1 Tax=Streptomyces sp. NPDC097610 TaxID=3157227 RepID=UPI003329135F
MTTRTLEDLITDAGGPLNLLRAHSYDRVGVSPDVSPPLIVPQVPQEFSLWEREARAWRESVALMDQSHHMPGLFLEGPDAQKLLTSLACNDLSRSRPNSAHQLICVNEDGQLIGDDIVFHLEENLFSIYGVPFALDWVRFHAETGGYDVTATYDGRSPVYSNGHPASRPNFRYQIQGPLAEALIEKLNGGPIGNVKFFHMTEITIAGVRCRALRHGVAGAIGLELWGPWEHRDLVRDTIIEAGREFDLRLVGGMSYLITAMEAGWYQMVLPAIYTGASMAGYRKWLRSDSMEGVLRLAGSLQHGRVEDYYRTPYDLGYGKFVGANHEYIGKDALTELRESGQPALNKVTLRWNPEDTAGLLTEMLTPGGKDVRALHLPCMADKLDLHFDRISNGGTDIAGNSAYTAYTPNERAVLSIALVDSSVEIGEEIVIHWGEAGGGYGDSIVPATDFVEIRAVVSPAPYADVAREGYRKGLIGTAT